MLVEYDLCIRRAEVYKLPGLDNTARGRGAEVALTLC